MDNQSNNITESLVGKSVLVFGEDTRSFLTVIRSLANAGMLVDVNIYNKTSPANFSNCIRNSFNFNFQSMSIEEWKKAVTTLIIENHYDLVVPCDERAIFPLIEIRKNIEALTPALIVFGIPDSRLLKPLFNKVETRKVAEQNQIRVAKGAEVSLKEIDTGTLVQQFGLPLVMDF